VAIYGPLPEQLRDPNSCVSHLRRMFRVRKVSRIAFSKLISVPEVEKPGVVVTLFERPEHQGWIITALNFGREPFSEPIELPQLARRSAQLIYSTHGEKPKSIQISAKGSFPLELEPIQGRMFVVQ
jgi:hypothetical protein